MNESIPSSFPELRPKWMVPLPLQLCRPEARNHSWHLSLSHLHNPSITKYCYFISITLIFPFLSKGTSLSTSPEHMQSHWWLIHTHDTPILRTESTWPCQHKKSAMAPLLSGCWQIPYVTRRPCMLFPQFLPHLLSSAGSLCARCTCLPASACLHSEALPCSCLLSPLPGTLSLSPLPP